MTDKEFELLIFDISDDELLALTERLMEECLLREIIEIEEEDDDEDY